MNIKAPISKYWQTRHPKKGYIIKGETVAIKDTGIVIAWTAPQMGKYVVKGLCPWDKVSELTPFSDPDPCSN